MSLVVVEHIFNNIIDALEQIAGTTILNVDITEVVASDARGTSPKHGQIVVEFGDSERVPDLDVPGNPPGEGWRQIFNIHLNVLDETVTTAAGLLATRYVGAVCNTIRTGSSWYTIGGKAINAEFLDWTRKDADGGIGGITLPLAVMYRVSEYDMTVQR